MDKRKLAVVTGASSGIGLELARVFAQNDYDLIIAAETDKINTQAKLLQQYNGEVIPVIADLSTQEGVNKLYEEITRIGRPVDAAALNAGVGQWGEFVTTEFEDELNLMNLNMVYLVCLTKKILKDMVKRNEGKILFTSSIAAEMPGPYYSVYAASKAFIQSFAEALHYEIKHTHPNITITSLQPGATETEFFERAGMENTKAGQDKKDDPAQVAKEGFDALMDDKDHVVGGSFFNKLKTTAAKLMTESQGAAAQAKDTKPLH